MKVAEHGSTSRAQKQHPFDTRCLLSFMKQNGFIADLINAWYSCANIMFPGWCFYFPFFFFLIEHALRTIVQDMSLKFFFKQQQINAMSS